MPFAVQKRVLHLGAGLIVFSLVLLFGSVKGIRSQNLPPLQTYPIPQQLATWQDQKAGDYFDKLDKTPVGALIWTQFPVRVFLDISTSKAPREKAWVAAVQQSIADWNRYLPLVETTDSASAEITIRRGSVPISREKDGRIKPIRFAQTQFEFYTQANRLWHRMTIVLSPNQADASLLAGARHELGHALGIWGHSDRVSDVMYFSQVKQPPEISGRDVNTLQRVYGGMTRLGGLINAPTASKN